ncbi:Efflux pump roqT [Colletotrichum higginsianum]|uniref:Efflux pump roqT n=1 Tax=Colletotrichum higginsianum TaxID=80884 RepID=A0A4T0VET7_9PEZI|nr:Efflux pump roqT [Colletotrichum higginsianum]
MTEEKAQDSKGSGEPPADLSAVVTSRVLSSEADSTSQDTNNQSAQTDSGQITGPKLYMLLVSLYLSVFCLAMDKTMLSPALGAITSEFGTVKDVGWYTSSYLLSSAAVQPLYGTIYKSFNTKWNYMTAIVVFEIGSLMAALASTSSLLILGRAICGLGDAGIASGTYVILAKALPIHKRAVFFGLLGAVWGIASVLGPLLGGYFADHLTWRWCFWINLPIGGVAFLVVGFVLSASEYSGQSKERQTVLSRVRQLDLAGTAALLPGVVMLLLATQWGGTEYSWSSPTIIGLFAGSGVLLLLFAGIEHRAQDSGLLPPRFFKNRDVCSAIFFSLFFGASYLATIPYLSIFFQAIQNASAVNASLHLLPLSISSVLSSISTGIIIGILGNYNVIILVDFALMCVGLGLITTFSLDTPMSHWFPFEVILGLGVGVGFQAGQVVVQNSLPFHLLSQATSNVQFFMSLGGAVSVSASQAAFQNGIVKAMARSVPQVSPSVVLDAGASKLQQTLEGLGLSSDEVTAIRQSYMTGLRNAYYIVTAMAGCAFLAALGLRWKRLTKAASKPPAKT